jgi:hypothetical protein
LPGFVGHGRIEAKPKHRHILRQPLALAENRPECATGGFRGGSKGRADAKPHVSLQGRALAQQDLTFRAADAPARSLGP